MPDKTDELCDYICTCISRGFDEHTIIESLINANWPRDRIQVAINRLSDRKPAEPRKHFTVKDFMNTEPVKCPKGKTIDEVLALLREKGTDYVFIVDKGRMEGFITTDLLLSDDDILLNRHVPCEKVMGRSAIYCRESDTFLDVCTKMKMYNTDKIPVIRKGKLVGIVSFSRLLEIIVL